MQDPTNGNIKANLTASKARMAAAKDSLMEKFNLDASELESHIKAACASRRRRLARHKVSMKRQSGMAQTIQRNMIDNFTKKQLQNYLKKNKSDVYAAKKLLAMFE